MRNQFQIKDIRELIELNRQEQKDSRLPMAAFVGAQLKERKAVGEKKTMIMSTEIMDRDGEIIKLSGGNVDNYNKNPIIAWSHETRRSWMDLLPFDPDNIIGKGFAYMDGSLLMNDIEFEPKEINPLAWKIESKIAFGSLNAGSIGFIPYEGSYGENQKGEDPNIFYIRKWELLEYSIVPIPSNPAALITERQNEKVIDKNDTKKTRRSIRVARERVALLASTY